GPQDCEIGPLPGQDLATLPPAPSGTKTAVPPPLAGRPAGRQTGGGTVPYLLYIHPGASTRMPDYKPAGGPPGQGNGAPVSASVSRPAGSCRRSKPSIPTNTWGTRPGITWWERTMSCS